MNFFKKKEHHFKEDIIQMIKGDKNVTVTLTKSRVYLWYISFILVGLFFIGVVAKDYYYRYPFDPENLFGLILGILALFFGIYELIDFKKSKVLFTKESITKESFLFKPHTILIKDITDIVFWNDTTIKFNTKTKSIKINIYYTNIMCALILIYYLLPYEKYTRTLISSPGYLKRYQLFFKEKFESFYDSIIEFEEARNDAK